jgi:uncharacterized protein (TIRG00374 family)
MKWQVILGMLVSAVCVPLIIAQVNVDQLGMALHRAHYIFLVPAMGALACTHLIRAWRWRYILAPVKPLPFLRLLAALSIGLMANMLLPAHAGEVMRAYILRRQEQVRIMAVLATLVVERVADLLSILLIVMCLLVFASVPIERLSGSQGLRLGGYIAALLCALLVGGLWLVTAKTPQMAQLLRHTLAFLPPRWLHGLIEALTAFALGLQALKKGWHLVIILLLSFLQWMLVAVNNALIFHAFELQLPLAAICLVLVMEIVGVLIPSAPGFIGTYHAAVVAGLAVFGVPHAQALSVAIIMHATFFFPGILAGLVFLWRESLSLQELWSVRTQELDP